MKVVGFKQLGKKNKKKKTKIFCISHVFRNLMIIFSVLIFLLMFNLINNSFNATFKECISNFISALDKIQIL